MLRRVLSVFLIGIMLVVLLPGLVEIQEVFAQGDCPDNNNIWNPGMQAQLRQGADVFQSPDPNSAKLAYVNTGEVVTIVGNYQCAYWGTSKTRWQYVQTASGVNGWVSEKQYGRSSRFEQYSGAAPSDGGAVSQQPSSQSSGGSNSDACPGKPNPFSIGMQARLRNSSDLHVSTNLSSGVIESLSSGDVVTIAGNYSCAWSGMSRSRWQYVRTASGNEGWLFELQWGRSSSLEPLSSSAPAQQSQPASQPSSQPAQQESQGWTVTDGCSDHPEQTYQGESSPPSGDYLRVDYSGLRVRIGPGTQHCINGYAVEGRYYPVHNIKGQWALITGTYGAGWVHTDYVTLYGGYAGQQTSNATNDSDSVNWLDNIYSDGLLPDTIWEAQIESDLDVAYDVSSDSWLIKEATFSFDWSGNAYHACQMNSWIKLYDSEGLVAEEVSRDFFGPGTEYDSEVSVNPSYELRRNSYAYFEVAVQYFCAQNLADVTNDSAAVDGIVRYTAYLTDDGFGANW